MPDKTIVVNWSSVAGTVALACALASPLKAAPAKTANDIKADFTIYVGGVLFVEGSFNLRVADDDYDVATNMATAGLAARFYPATYKLKSEGRIGVNAIEPRRFVSDTVAKKDTRLTTLTYGKDRTPHINATPPYNADDLEAVTADQKRNTIDPVSAFIVPVSQTQGPCPRTLPIFDGKRRYNLTFSYQGEKRMTPPDASNQGEHAEARTAIVCTVKYQAIAPIEKKRKFTNALRRNDDMRIWLAPFDNGRLYVPVRFELKTPIGMAVMELKNLTEKMDEKSAGQAPKTRLAQD